MRSARLFLHLTSYYVAVTGIVAVMLWHSPSLIEYLPIGGAEGLLNDVSGNPLESVDIAAARVETLGGSIVWLIVAIVGSLLSALPVSWTYIEVRNRDEYDQSLVETIVVLPIAVTSIIVVVHDSLALAFSLAGVVGVVRFRNALKSSGDALFILLAIGIGLAAGIGAMELALVMSVAFNYCFLVLWVTDYGARKGTHRYLRKNHRHLREEAGSAYDEAEVQAPVPP